MQTSNAIASTQRAEATSNEYAHVVASSFRDPSGYLFTYAGTLHRAVQNEYKTHYEKLVSSGLLEKLISKSLLIPHTENVSGLAQQLSTYKVITPERVPYISYPHEWSFSQLKDAALATLEIQELALEHGMTLKDASAYNIQFYKGKPILIDTLSFETISASPGWIAYRQFCQHFLAPLALMSKCDIGLGKLSLLHIDGIPLELASKLLPWSTKLNFGLQLHIHMHARSQARYAAKAPSTKVKSKEISLNGLRGLIDSLKSTVLKLKWNPAGTEWGDYYNNTNYSDLGSQHKRELIAQWTKELSPKSVYDFGANTGVFSREAAKSGANVISFDYDTAAVEINYRRVKQHKENTILPLLLDLTNPSTNYGWNGEERMSLFERGRADLAMGLALIHHLAISNNVPLERIAQFFHNTGQALIIEFVPKVDSQVQKLLASRRDIFPSYTLEGFEQAFSNFFKIEKKTQINGSERTLFLMSARSSR